MKKLLCSIAAFIFLAQLCQAGAALCSAGITTEVNASDSNEHKEDREFVMKAAAGSRLEVTLGQLAAGNSSTQAVRDFGQQMVTDHSKANAELEALAQSKNIMLPGSTEKEHQKEVDRLSKLKGADFDKAYMKLMVDDHRKDIDLFERETGKGTDAELKSWAAEKLPVLRHHLHMAEDAEKSIGQ